MSNQIPFIAPRPLVLLILLLAVAWAVDTNDLFAQDKCDTAVSDAQNLYRIGRTAEVIVLLNRCLPDSVDEADKVQGYRFLALSYSAEDNLDKARETVKQLLNLNENYEPEPSDDPLFRTFVEQEKRIRAGRKQTGSRIRRFILVGVGLAAGAAILKISVDSGSSKPARLPDPPAFPDNE
ncbi:MAG: hypothetical protein ACE5IY_09975 [bacterium]